MGRLRRRPAATLADKAGGPVDIGQRVLKGSPRRLVAVFAVLCIAPLALLTYTTIHLADRAVVDEVNARVRTTSTVASVLVGQEMESLAELTSSYASRPAVITALAGGNPARFDSPVIDSHLSQLLEARTGIGGVFLTDASCRLTHVAPATPTIVGTNFSHRDWCRGVRATGRPYVSEAYRTAIQGSPLVVAAAAFVRDGTSGEPLGILAVVYTLDAVRGFSEQLAAVQGIQLTITDQQGTLVVGAATDAPDGTDGLRSATGDPNIRNALAGRSGITRSGSGDDEALAAFAPVEGIGWAVSAEVPAHEALAGVRRLDSAVLTVAALLGVVLVAGLVLLMRTLAQRRDADRALVERDAHTRAILEKATDAFISMDAAGHISGWNAQAEKTFGWSEEEALGRPLRDTIIPAGQRDAHEHGLERFWTTGTGPVVNQRVDVTALHRDGHEFPAELAVWPVRSGGTCTFNSFVQDITERKRAEAELSATRDQALEASKLKSEFLANMSHEIRTPMNGVLGMTSLLLDTELRVDQREFAETVRSSGEALLSILNDILDFSKIEAGRLDLEEIDFDLRRLVEDVASLLGLSAQDKGLELACSLPVDMPDTVRGDPSRIRQILTNLVGNAVKFTSTGEVVLEVTVPDPDDPEPMVWFRVIDTGIGIPGDAQRTVFESFSQADAGTTRRYGGTGLGLAISRQLVELMGGRIGVHSEVGTGSTFWFTIPLHQPTHAGPVGTSLAGLRILIVDDNATNRAILSGFLQAWGTRFESVASGSAALDALAAAADRDEPFDVALLDLNMPDMDGIELAQAIREDEARPAPALVLLTSSSQHGEVDRAREAGVDRFVSKPVRQSLLFDCLGALGPPRRSRRAPASPPVTAAPAPRPDRDPGAPVRRVLVAEDNKVNQRVAVGMLAKLGCDTEVVVDGAEAVRAAMRTTFDAILMDCQMPVLDGYEATEEIRRLEGPAGRTPIIAVTASAMKADEDRCLAAGMDGYLAKPFTVEALAVVLDRHAPGGTGPTMAAAGDTAP